jgi:hypothetical protein
VFRATEGGALYAIVVFLIGIILGTIRVLLLAPRLGESAALVVEAPIILTASWFVCCWRVDRLDVRRTVSARSLMGFVAFSVLMSAEFGMGAVSVDRSWTSLPLLERAPERSASPRRSSLPHSR